MMTRSMKTVTLCLLTTLVAAAAAPRAPQKVSPNDNRKPAGTLKNGVLTIKLEARQGLWYPEGDQGRALDVAAWGEEGKTLSVPGPLIRVPVGTEVRATIHNTLGKQLKVFGFGKARGMMDSVVLAAGASRDVQFKATAPGTYYYTARGETQIFDAPVENDMPLVGAIVVDPPNAPANPDRVLVLSWWFTFDSTSPTGLGRSTMAINGLSWPHTERFDLTQGDSVHWRVLNMTGIDHPMHLHGFYFRLESKGNGVTDSLFPPAQQQLAVTQIVKPFTSIALSWVPSRPGNWIYHCHFSDHISHHSSLDANKGVMDASMLGHHESDRPHQMFGLVLGLRVAPKGTLTKSTEAPRAIRLFVRDKPNVYGKKTGYSFVLGGTQAERDRNAMVVPGPTLVLERNKPVAITVINQAKDRAAVHWHGIELESYPDGVPGWSGQGKEILPSIAPGDSLTVRFTPPRAGTFMYHSHFNEAEQIASGLYGPIVVVEPGQTYDPERDRVLFVGTAGSSDNVIVGPFAAHLLNGQAQPKQMDLSKGTTYRLRLFNLADGGPTVVSLMDGKTLAMWKAVAKDGAAFPASQVATKPATLTFEPGEIYDFEFTPAKTGRLAFTFGPPPLPPGPPPASLKLPPNLPPPPPTRTMVVNVK